MTVHLDPVFHAAKPTAPGAPNAQAGSDWARAFQAAGRLAWFHAPNERGVAAPLLPKAAALARQQPAGQGPSPGGRTSLKEGPMPSPVQRSHVAVPHGPSLQVASLGGAPSNAQPGPGRALVSAAERETRTGLAVAGPPGVPSAPGSPSTPSPLSSLPSGSPLRPSPAATPAAAPGTSPCAGAWPATTVPTSRRQPLRVHVAASAQGVTVWLGADVASDVLARRGAIALELRRLLAASGQRLDALFCNGKPVDASSTSQPWEP